MDFCELVSSFFCVHPSPKPTEEEERLRSLKNNSYFTFSGDAGGRLGGGGCVSVGRGLSAPGCGSGHHRGGEGVDVCGVGNVAQLVLCLG